MPAYRILLPAGGFIPADADNWAVLPPAAANTGRFPTNASATAPVGPPAGSSGISEVPLVVLYNGASLAAALLDPTLVVRVFDVNKVVGAVLASALVPTPGSVRWEVWTGGASVPQLPRHEVVVAESALVVDVGNVGLDGESRSAWLKELLLYNGTLGDYSSEVIVAVFNFGYVMSHARLPAT